MPVNYGGNELILFHELLPFHYYFPISIFSNRTGSVELHEVVSPPSGLFYCYNQSLKRERKKRKYASEIVVSNSNKIVKAAILQIPIII